MSTPAGWYPDPTNRHQNRWFDGNDWTDHVADGQAVSTDPVQGGPAAASTQPTPAATPDPAATSVSPAASGPPPGAPGSPPPGGGAPLGTYVGPESTSSGGSRKTLLIAGVAAGCRPAGNDASACRRTFEERCNRNTGRQRSDCHAVRAGLPGQCGGVRACGLQCA